MSLKKVTPLLQKCTRMWYRGEAVRSYDIETKGNKDKGPQGPALKTSLTGQDQVEIAVYKGMNT